MQFIAIEGDDDEDGLGASAGEVVGEEQRTKGDYWRIESGMLSKNNNIRGKAPCRYYPHGAFFDTYGYYQGGRIHLSFEEKEQNYF